MLLGSRLPVELKCQISSTPRRLIALKMAANPLKVIIFNFVTVVITSEIAVTDWVPSHQESIPSL